MITVKQNIIFILLLVSSFCLSQNSMVGDGFGGRLWYSPTNYGVGSYSAFTLCYDDTCASSANQLYGWGDDIYSTIGIVGPGSSSPVPIPSMTDVSYFSSGYFSGAIKKDGTGWAWGNASNIGAVISFSPIQIINNVKFLSACSRTITYVKNDGTIWSIGLNTNGNFGNGLININPVVAPVKMLNITNAVRVSNNRAATIVLLDDSTVWSSGDAPKTGLGISVFQTSIPMQIPTLPKIVDIKSNQLGSIALSDSGNVYFWGNDLSSGNSIYSPILVPNLNNIVAISGCDDGHFFYALDENKNFYAWGRNDFGQCGLSSVNTNISTPQLVETNVIDIMAGESFGYIVKDDNSLWATGAGFTAFSIWLDLSNIPRDTFTRIDPTVFLNNCAPMKISTLNDSCKIVDGIIFPNVFSPNGDGENDEFYFPSEGVIDLNFKIFNRWGQLIFETNQINTGWNGRTNTGKICSEGTYYYILNYKFAAKEWERKASYVTLLR